MKFLLIAILSLILIPLVDCFIAREVVSNGGTRLRPSLQTTPQGDEQIPANSEPLLIDDDLLSPSVIMRRESLLFSENPSSQNIVKDVWEWCGQNLPVVVTGDTSTAKPCAGLYNMILVRIPTLVAGIVYTIHLTQGHPLIVDMGNGPFTVNPVLVGGVLWAILRT